MALFFYVIISFLYRQGKQIHTRVRLTGAGKSSKPRSSDSLTSTLCPLPHPTRPLEEIFNEKVRKTTGKSCLLFLFHLELLSFPKDLWLQLQPNIPTTEFRKAPFGGKAGMGFLTYSGKSQTRSIRKRIIWLRTAGDMCVQTDSTGWVMGMPYLLRGASWNHCQWIWEKGEGWR